MNKHQYYLMEWFWLFFYQFAINQAYFLILTQSAATTVSLGCYCMSSSHAIIIILLATTTIFVAQILMISCCHGKVLCLNTYLLFKLGFYCKKIIIFFLGRHCTHEIAHTNATLFSIYHSAKRQEFLPKTQRGLNFEEKNIKISKCDKFDISEIHI